jgi:hypothetical protein
MRLSACLGARHRRQGLVVDVDELDGVLGDVGRLGDDRGDLLALEAHLVRGEHGLRVAGEGRHPGEVVLRQELACHDGDDARELLRLRGVDRPDTRVRERAPEELEVEHPRQGEVVEVLALAADEAGVFEPPDRVTDPPDLFGGRHR